MGQTRQSVTTVETSYEFTPHDARASAIHPTTGRSNTYKMVWNHKRMPFKKVKATAIIKSGKITIICQINKLFKDKK